MSLKLHLRSYGEGPPLLVLHGMLGSSGNWHSLSRNVFSKAYRVLAMDLRNHGRSPHTEDFSYDSMADDILEVMNRYELGTAHLLGHSMGGKVAMHFALKHSERVEALVVADIAPVDYPHLHENTLEALQKIDVSNARSRAEIESELAVHFEDPSFRQFLLKGVSRRDGHYRWSFNLEWIVKGYPSLQEAVLGWQPHEGPTLFLRGARSQYVRDEHMLQIRTLFPYAEVETIEKAGHWIHSDAPAEFGDRVMSFLKRS